MCKVLVVVVVACLAIVSADKVKFKDCGSVGGTIKYVDVSPCPAFPCKFYKGKTVNVTVDFGANEDIAKATTKVYGIIRGVEVPFPVGDDACQNMTCPVKKGSAVSYKNAVYVEKIFPQIELAVKWEVLDANKKVVFCFEVPVEITS